MNFDYGAYGYDQIFVSPDFSSDKTIFNPKKDYIDPKTDINLSLMRSLQNLPPAGSKSSSNSHPHLGPSYHESLQDYMNRVVQDPTPQSLINYEKMYNDLKYENYVLYLVLFFVVILCLIMNNSAFDKGMQYGISLMQHKS